MENTRFKNAIKCLSSDLYKLLSVIPYKIAENAQEIILRVERPVIVQCNSKRYYFTDNNCVTDSLLDTKMVTVSRKSLFETFQNICNYSVYSRQNEINNGYITLKGGHRAGICGTAVVSDRKIVNIKDISSINIRIAREIIGCSEEIFHKTKPEKGLIICGAPCSGKTTIIRDLARRLSFDYKVSIIDERSEIASVVSGVSQNDIGMCDVYDSYIKSEAIIQSIRSMSPQIIVCDEISTLDDVKAIDMGVNSAVSFILTLHADDMNSLLKRPIAKHLLETNAFEQIVFLNSRDNVGKIKSIKKLNNTSGDLYA